VAQAIGIDLGTTYSSAAVVRNGRPELLTNRDGDALTPSVVLFGDDQVLVGAMAKRSAAAMPDDCVQFVKRHMGDPHWRFIDSRDKEYSPEELSGLILRRLAEDASMALGEEVRDVVVTVPAYFDDARRTATRQAGEIAQLNVLRLINEPTAAAVAYGLDQGEAGTVFVYDLGGGTFDVTILRASGTEFEVVATDGDRNLGGFDFDNELMRHVAGAVQEQGGPDLMDDPVAQADLRDRCEIAKRTLTTMPSATVVTSAGGRSYTVKVSRDEFEAASRHLLERTEVIAEGVLDDAGLSWRHVDQVLLVGGSTRMPMVRELVRRLSGATPEARINPDEAVSLGAALLADQVSAERAGVAPDMKVRLSIQDVTSQSLGTTALDDRNVRRNVVMIPRNTKIPCKREDVFFTMVPDQRFVLVDITEGEGEDPEYVAKLIEREIPLPAGLPDAAPIKHIMSYDIDGLVHLELFDETNGRHLGEVELDRPLNLDRSDVERMRQAMRRLDIQ
jgi:molecular chaperone DnaK